MSNLDNQPGRDDRTAFSNRSPIDRTSLDNRKSGMGTGTITAIIAAVVIIAALMLLGPWGNDRNSANNSTPATSNSMATTGQTSGAPRDITPTGTPNGTAPAPASSR